MRHDNPLMHQAKKLAADRSEQTLARHLEECAHSLYAGGPWGEPYALVDGGTRMISDAHSMDVYRKMVRAIWTAASHRMIGRMADELADALEDLHRYSVNDADGYAGSPCEAKVRAALELVGREVP